ncbi:hypothetical protein [Streptomyces cadmiisoli]|uniref:HEAT repeat domain-containing protein n=1 Tax=Streptomyces cadmiisoli TaxID=2184053 RepID=A0A2Z4ISE5_9ACTN|nr:hypothetical protein [Streptomyces cadmiisoli]AWW35650.1 hypothetical protein DN051_02370 [Streptomyces cadmiisoli]
MSMENRQEGFVDPQEPLLRTDWHSVEHCCPNDAPATPVILRHLLDDDTGKQGAALRNLYQAVTHQHTFYSATAPAATFVAAILAHPRTLAEVTDQTPWEVAHRGEKPRFLLRVGLLNWLRSTAADANDESPGGLQADIEAFRALRPALHDAIRPLLTDRDREIREAALAALLPLLAAPELAHHRAELRDTVLALATEDTPYRRHAVRALAAWGEDTTPFQREANTPTDARPSAEGFADDPPF